MSDIQSLTPFRFEEFPDEILLEIFKLVKPVDLHCFFGLNRRINNVLRDLNLNAVINYSEYEEEEEDFNYLMIFSPNQFIRLELRCNWNAFDMITFQELRSLTLDCLYLSEHQFDQLLTVNLPYLERFSIDNMPHYYAKQLFLAVIDNEHFPSLKICQFSGEFYHLLDLDNDHQLPNNTIRILTVNKWVGSQLNSLLNLLPNLHRFETNLIDPVVDPLNANVKHTSLEHLRLTVEDPLNDLKIIFQYTPLLKQLRVTGKINENSVLEYFEALAKIFRSELHHLRRFDCELYFHASTDQVDVIVIQQLHPLFQRIQCHFGKSINQCYSTDLDDYPPFSEYSYIERQSYTAHNWGVMGGYDSDHYDDGYDQDDNDDNGWVDYGLDYRGNYKANYGGSPWSDNNDD